MKKFMRSVACASNGIRYTFATEKNIRVLLLIVIAEITTALLLEIPRLELLLLLWIAAVLFALELVNTAIERLADRVTTQHDAQIGIVKDVMAGAVMVASVFAFLIGCIIFFEPVLKLIQQ